MPYPPEIALVACTVGGASALESGTQLVLSAEITSSRGLMWGATGWQYPSITRTVAGTEGAELSFSLPATDLSGWRLLDDSGSTIDVSTPGSYTHTYTIRLTTLLSGRPVGQRTIGPFVLPAGSGPVDLDTMLPAPTVAGGVVLVPDSWDERVAAAEALLDQVPATVAAYLADNPQTAVDPADTGFDIVLLLGQSNMSGRGTPYDAYTDPADPRIWQYGASGTYDGKLAVAFEPLAMVDVPTGIGPGLAFARWYASMVPSNRRVLLVPAAKGGTPLVTDALDGWRYGVPGNLTALAIAQAQTAHIAAGANARFAAVLWAQGEQDASDDVTGAAYIADLDALIAGLRTSLSTPDLPFIIARMVPEFAQGTATAIDLAHIGTPSRVLYTAVATARPAGQTPDNIHYNAAAQRLIGRSMAEAYLTATAPVVEAAPQQVGTVSTSVDDGQVALSWPAVTAYPSVTDYLVEYKESVSGTWLTFADGTSPTPSAIVTGLINATPYDFRVSAVNSSGTGTASATVSAVPMGALVITDSFNRADNALTLGTTDTGEAWEVTGDSVWGISSNTAYRPAGSGSQAALVEMGQRNMAVQGRANPGKPFVGRFEDTSNYYYVQSGNPTLCGVRISGSNTAYAPTATTTTNANVLRMELTDEAGGTRVVIKVDGVEVLNQLETNANRPTGTKAGMLTSSNTAVMFDDFRAEAL